MNHLGTLKTLTRLWVMGLFTMGIVAARVDAQVGPFNSLEQDAGNANPDNGFRYDSTLGGTGGYIFNLSTKGLTTGTYNLTFKAGSDPVMHKAQFQAK